MNERTLAIAQRMSFRLQRRARRVHGWRGADHFDPPRPGARAFLEALVSRGYEIVIFTTGWPDQWER